MKTIESYEIHKVCARLQKIFKFKMETFKSTQKFYETSWISKGTQNSLKICAGENRTDFNPWS